MKLFNRKVEILIANKVSSIALKVENLRVTFRVDKKLETGKEGSNSCTVTIYNLSKDSRNYITAKDSVLILKAGYEESGLEVLYKGDIDLVSHTHEVPNVVTTIECQDVGVLSTQLSLSFKSGTSAKSILNQVTQLMGAAVDSGSGLTAIADQIFNQGFSFNGVSQDALNKLCGKLNVQWSLQNGQLKFLTPSTTDNKSAIVLNTETGLIDSPKKEIQKVDKESIKNLNLSDTPEGVEKPITNIRSLLYPKLEPGGIVKVESLEYNTFYRIISVKHEGDLFSQQWESTLECQDV